MYFQRIETDKTFNIQVNNNLKAAAARRLGELQRGGQPSAKRASLLWNVEKQWANGAKKGKPNRKQAARLETRVKDFEAGSQRLSKNFVHVHHRPGSFQ